MGSRQQGFNKIKQVAGDLLLSTFADYSTVRTLLTFKCNDCGNEFVTTSFLYQRSCDGKKCISCKHRNTVTSLDTRQVFINKCVDIHGQYYDYSLLPDKFNKSGKVTIICPEHGEFTQTPDVHLRGSGCSKCKIDNISQANRSNTTDFTYKANHIHNFKYNYSDVEYTNAITPVTIICPEHGEFTQTPDVHLRGSGCSKCNITSGPVQSIMKALDNTQHAYSIEKTFDGCIGVGGRKLRFDIFIPEFNLCVEYDGPHHYQPTHYGSLTLEKAEQQFVTQQDNDAIKNKFCKQQHIDLIRIPYTHHHPAASVLKYLSRLTPERYMYSWNDLDRDVKRIINHIKSHNYSHFAVYGIARGGIAFTIPISYHFGDECELGIITYQRYDGNDKSVQYNITHSTKNIPIFLVDDLISSGETMNKSIKSLAHKFKKSKIHPIVIFGEENKNGIVFINEHPKQWIEFPYEIE